MLKFSRTGLPAKNYKGWGALTEKHSYSIIVNMQTNEWQVSVAARNDVTIQGRAPLLLHLSGTMLSSQEVCEDFCEMFFHILE